MRSSPAAREPAPVVGVTRRIRVAICHQSFVSGDAIGNDICGMYRLFEAMGFEPHVLCEFTHGAPETVRVHTEWGPSDGNRYGVVIYHHSIHWPKGEQLLRAYAGHPVLKYHNVTPPEFFAPYFPQAAQACAEGRRQTATLVTLARGGLWLADSAYNGQELVHAGAAPDRVREVPPFSLVDSLWARPNTARYDSGRRTALAVGRLVPNKGHKDALRILRAYRRAFGDDLDLVFLGKWDPNLLGYYEELRSLVHELDLVRNVSFVLDATQATVDSLFHSSHVYLCTSQHEGFCVPVIEAQAIGLPVVASRAAAVGATMGEGQLLFQPPKHESDFAAYAKALREVFEDPSVRETVVARGKRNVFTRFTTEAVENTLLDSMLEVLQELA